jgi:hypothetical protein
MKSPFGHAQLIHAEAVPDRCGERPAGLAPGTREEVYR